MIPHLWAIGPRMWWCVIGNHPWSGQDQYGPCVAAMPWAVAAVRRAEADTGASAQDLADLVGITLS